jgi:proteasome assembly chaperone (PAC2) family protein
MPWLAVRVLYSILAVFTNSSTFSITGDYPLVQLFMATVEEFIIVCIYTLAGLTVSR